MAKELEKRRRPPGGDDSRGGAVKRVLGANARGFLDNAVGRFTKTKRPVSSLWEAFNGTAPPTPEQLALRNLDCVRWEMSGQAYTGRSIVGSPETDFVESITTGLLISFHQNLNRARHLLDDLLGATENWSGTRNAIGSALANFELASEAVSKALRENDHEAAGAHAKEAIRTFDWAREKLDRFLDLYSDSRDDATEA